MIKMRIKRHILLTAAVFSFCLFGTFPLTYAATKGIILSGGYGSRLQEGLAKEFPSLTGGSKPLVPVAEKPMINYNLEILSQAADVDEIIISTSRGFIDEHNTWFNSVGSSVVVNRNPSTGEIDTITGTYGGKPVTIVNQGETPGSTYSLSYALEKKAVTDDFVVLGGDTLYTGLDLNQFISAGKAGGRGLIGVYEVPASQTTDKPVVVTDAAGKVTKYQISPIEPEISEGKTDPSVGSLTYWMPNSFRQLIRDFLSEGANPDQTRNIFPYAMGRGNDIYAYDVGPEVFDCNEMDVFKTANVVFTAQGKSRAQIEQILSNGQVTIGKRVGGDITEVLALDFDLRLRLAALILSISSPGEITLSNILAYLSKPSVSELPVYSITVILKYKDKIEASSVSALDARLAEAINWVEGLLDETSSVKSYARPNILNALFTEGLLDMICGRAGIGIADISTIYGAFAMAGEYTYEYFMVVKTNDGNPYFFDAEVLKEGIDPASYNMASVVNLRKSLHTQDPSLTGSSFGSVNTGTGIPVEAKQHDKFGMNSPPAVPPEELLDPEIDSWWNEKYGIDAEEASFLDALAISDLYDAGVPAATLEMISGVSRDALPNMIIDIHNIAGSYTLDSSYPDMFDANFIKVNLKPAKLIPFDAYTIWFLSYNFGKTNDELARLYNVKSETIVTIVGYVTLKCVPAAKIEQRLRSESASIFDAVNAITPFEPYGAYYKKIINGVYLSQITGTSLRTISIRELDSLLGISPYQLFDSLKETDPDFAKRVNELGSVLKVKNWVFGKRIWPVLFGGYYEKISFLFTQTASFKEVRITLSPYDLYDVLGIFVDRTGFTSPLIERAGGFTHDDIKNINVDKWFYETDKTTIYEVIVKKGKVTQSRFLLHILKEGLSNVQLQTTYDNLVILKDQSVFKNLYGVGTAEVSGRAAFATDKVFYSTEADLIKNGVSKDRIKQYIARRLKIVTGATQSFSDGCWVITDPAAIGFIDKGNGAYEARIADASRINKGVAAENVSNFYRTDPKWQSYGIDLSVSGGAPYTEPYTYVEGGVTKTVNIDWYDGLISETNRPIIKASLIDNGMLLFWTDILELPVESNMRVEFLGARSYKYNYRIIFEDYEPFVFGFVWNDAIPHSVKEQFDDLFKPARIYWKSKGLPEYLIPLPGPGEVHEITDPYDGVVKEVYTRGYIDGYDRRAFRDFLSGKLGPAQITYIERLCVLRESASLWMIWKGSGGKIFYDIGSTNVIFEIGDLGVFRAKYFDCDSLLDNIATLGGLFDLLTDELYAAEAFPKDILLGFYDAMKLDGMADTEIINKFQTELSSVASEVVDEAIRIIKEGRPITWLDNPKEDEKVPYKADQRRAVAKSLIDGDYGLLPETLHELFPGEEETILINNIRGAFSYKDPVRDHYTLYLDVLISGKEATIPLSMAVSNAGTSALRAQYDVNNQALYGIDPQLAQKSLSGKDSEVLDQTNNYISKNVIAEEYSGTPMSWSAYESLPIGDPERLPILKALSHLYANLYDATNENAIPGLPSAVLNNPKDVLIYKLVEGRYFARPIDYAAITGPITPAEMIDHYVAAIPDLLIHPDIFLKPIYLILGRDFLVEAAITSVFKNDINIYLSKLPEPGSINDVLYKLGYSMNQEGYSLYRDTELQKFLALGKIRVNNIDYPLPASLNTLRSDPAEVNKLFDAVLAVLGEEGSVADIRAFSESSVARAMQIALNSAGISDIEMDMLKVVGINTVDELKALLKNLSLTTSKGYTLTPKNVYMLFNGGSVGEVTVKLKFRQYVFLILNGGGFDKEDLQPFSALYLTEGDFMALTLIAKNNGLGEYPNGLYHKGMHSMICRDLDSLLHEISHAQLRALLDYWARTQEPLISSEIFGNGNVVRVIEGDAQIGLISKLITVNRALEALLSGYMGFFANMALAEDVYGVDDSSIFAKWGKDNAVADNPASYKVYTEEVLDYIERYGSDAFAYDYLKEYLKNRLTVSDFLDRFRSHYALKSPAGKVVAVSDIHGGYEQLVSTLVNAGIIQRGGAFGDPNYFEMPTHIPSEPLHKYTYTGGGSLLIFAGDSINKGEYSYEVRLLIGWLKRKTQVIELWGNHEAYLFEAAHISENAPNLFGLKSALNTLQQFSTTDGIAAFIQQMLYKTDSPRASLEDLIDDSAVSSARGVDYMLSGILEDMLKDLKTLAKVTMLNGDSYLFLHAGMTKASWDKIKNEGSPEAILYKFNELVLTDPELFWDIINSESESWINDQLLVSDICNRLKVKYIVVGHKSHMGFQKSPNSIGFVGAEVGGFKRIIGIDTIMSPAKAVGDLPIQGHALVINPDGTRQYVASDEFPSPVIKNPARLNFLKNGNVEAIGADGNKAVILRKVFRDWYNFQGDLYSFPNEIGFLDLKEAVNAEYVVKGFKVPLEPEFIIFPDELTYPCYFLFFPDKVKMYYYDIFLGQSSFLTKNTGRDIFIDTLAIDETKMFLTALEDAVEAAKAVIIKTFKLNFTDVSPDKQRIFLKDSPGWYPQHVWDAIIELQDLGYLSEFFDDAQYPGYMFCFAEPSMAIAKFARTKDGKIIPYDPRSYDKQYDSQGNVVGLTPKDSQGQPVKDPRDPGRDLNLLSPYLGTEQSIETTSDGIKFILDGAEFLAPYASLLQGLPSDTPIKFKLTTPDGMADTYIWEKSTGQFKLITSTGPVIQVPIENAPRIEKFYSGVDVEKTAQWVWNKLFKFNDKAKAEYFFNQLDKAFIERQELQFASRNIATINLADDIFKVSYRWDISAELPPEVAVLVDNPNLPKTFDVFTPGGIKVGEVDWLKSLQDKSLVKVTGKIAPLPKGTYIDLSQATYGGQSSKIEFWVKSARWYMHENRCLGYLRKNYLGEEILGNIWGERYYYDMYQTGYIDEATMTLKQEGFIKVTQPEASMVSDPYLKPIGLKRIWAGFNKFMAKPYGPPVFIAIPETAILAYNIYKGAYESTDELYGDVTKAATRVAGFSTAIRVIARWGPKAFLSSSLILLGPASDLIVPAADYSGFAYSEWRAGEVVDGFVDINLEPRYKSAYRAWFAFLDETTQEKNRILSEFYPHGNRQILEYAIVEAAYDRWMQGDGKDADDDTQANYKTGLKTKARHYGRIYEEEIIDTVFDG